MRIRELSSGRRPSAPALVSVVALLVGLLSTVHVALAPGAAAAPRVYPVPTSDAGLGRIVTAPDGAMWFVMEKVNKVGRITPDGGIKQYTLPDTTTGAVEGVYDLDVAADGTIWVIYDFGRSILRFRVNAAGDPTEAHVTSLGSFPYGEQVEIGPGNVPWVSMSYDEDGLARIVGDQTVWHPNAPPCDGALAWGRDNAMWCQSDDRLIRSNADGSGGTTYPLPDDPGRPFSLAAGPTGSIWFARFWSGTIYTTPKRGQVGWLDHATGRTRIFSTGSLTAPHSLTMGPDQKMWFASRGTAAGIGHLDSQGRGALTKVGNYKPSFLTFAKDGSVWFTDRANNSIVRVPRSDLQRTNVNPGTDSVFTVGAPAGKLAVGRKPLVVKRNRVPLTIACPKGGATCRGKAVVQHPKRAKSWTAAKSYVVKPGKRVKVQLPLNKAGKRAVKRTPVKARALLVGGQRVTKQVRIRR